MTESGEWVLKEVKAPELVAATTNMVEVDSDYSDDSDCSDDSDNSDDSVYIRSELIKLLDFYDGRQADAILMLRRVPEHLMLHEHVEKFLLDVQTAKAKIYSELEMEGGVRGLDLVAHYEEQDMLDETFGSLTSGCDAFGWGYDDTSGSMEQVCGSDEETVKRRRVDEIQYLD
jgi:hypothetical protein